MKITDPDIIKSGEKDLIEAIKGDLDLEAVREIIERRMAASKLSATGGEIVVHNNKIAFRIDFSVELSGSLMFDRQGNHIPDSEDQTDSAPISGQPLDGDIDDMNLNEAFGDAAGLEADAGEDLIEDPLETDVQRDEIEDDDDLDIHLPDYSLDDAQEPDEDGISGTDEPNEANLLDGEALDADNEDDLDQLEKELGLSEDLSSLDDLEEGSYSTSGASASETAASGETVLDSTQGSIDDSLEDEDISDILKESRDFWEQKKDH